MQNSLNKNTDSTILNLEVLKKEYDTVLTQYNQAQTDYASTTSDEGSTSKSFTDIKGKTFWGNSLLSEDWTTASLEDCKTACAANTKCSGATYNPDRTYCSLRTGDTSITDGEENDFAIVSQKLKQLKVLSSLSDRLLDLNTQILRIVEQGKPELDEMRQQKNEQVSSLGQNYSGLTTQRESLDSIIKEVEKLNKVNGQSEIFIAQNYTTYMVLIIITIVVGIGIVLFSSVVNKSSSSEGVPSVAREEPEEPEEEPEEEPKEETEEEEEEPEKEEEEPKEEEKEDSTPSQEGGKYVKPKYRFAILIVLSGLMILLISQLAALCSGCIK